MYDEMFSSSYALNERIAREVVGTLPDSSLVLAIMDREGNCWSSDPESFEKLSLADGVLDDLRAKVDDGADPAVTQVGDVGVTMAQLATDLTNCGYVVVAVSRCGSESIPASLDMIETLISLVTLAARLIEKNSLLNEAQVKCYSVYGGLEAPAN
jgi:hypothetical protein